MGTDEKQSLAKLTQQLKKQGLDFFVYAGKRVDEGELSAFLKKI